MNVKLDRLTPERLEDFINFIQAKLNEQKSFQTKDILTKSQSALITPQLLTNYSHFSLKEGLTFLDCFDPENLQNVLALHESCYEAFSGLYDAFLSNFTQKKWGPFTQDELIKNVISYLENITPFPIENEGKIMITYEFGRNFNEFPLKPFLRFENLQVLKNRLFEGLKNLKLFTMIEEKYIATSILDKQLFPADYKRIGLEQELIKGGPFVLVPEHNKYAIWGLLKDHIRIVLRTNPSEQIKDLYEIIEILKKIEDLFDGGYKFHKNYGYLAENALDLGFNVRFSIETEIEVKKSDVLRQFCKSSGWEFEETCKIGKEKIMVKLIARKPNLLVEELEIMNNVIKGLVEI